MSRFLAVDWDGVEVRFVFGNQNQEKLSVLKIGSEPISREDTESTSGLPANLAAALQRLPQTHKVPLAKTFFAVGGSCAEVMYFTLPPSKEEEIPELLKNQAIRDMPNFSETYAIDFLPLGEASTGPRKVLAVAQSQTELKAIQNVGKVARCKPQKIEYRGAATAAFVLGSGLLEENAPPTLVANLLADELDLVVLKDQKIVYLRSIKLPGLEDPKQLEEKVFQEITRTCAVGLQDESDELIQSVLFLSGEGESATLLEQLRGHSLEVRSVDPLETARVQVAQKPQFPGRYTALLGMMLVEASGKKPAIDLLHPKSKPQPPNYAGITLLSVLLFGLILGGLYYWNKTQLKIMEARLDDAKKKYEELFADHNQWASPYGVLFNASTFDTRDAVWLDTLRDIAPHFPGQQDMTVTQMEYISGPINNNANYSGQIRVSAMVRDPNVIRTLKQNLEAKRMYTVIPATPTQNPAGGGYPWIYRFTIGCFKVQNPNTYLYFLSPELQMESVKQPEMYQ